MTHKQIYSAFQSCKKIYGTQEVHVQLIAKQLGVTASEIIEHIEANPTLFVTRMNSINSGYENKVLGNEYPGLLVSSVSSLVWLTTSSVIREGDNGGTIVLTPSAGTFKASTSTENWIVDAGTTGLTLAFVNNATATKTLTFTGTAYSGKLKIACKAAGVSGASNTDYIEIDIVERNMSAADYSLIESDIAAIETTIGTYSGGDDIATDLAALESVVGTYSGEDDIATDLAALQALNVITTTTLDLSLTNGSPAALPVTHSHVIVTANPELNPGEIALPASTGSGLKVTVIGAPSITTGIVFHPNDTDTINGENDTFLVPNKNSATLIDIAEGEWLLI